MLYDFNRGVGIVGAGEGHQGMRAIEQSGTTVPECLQFEILRTETDSVFGVVVLLRGNRFGSSLGIGVRPRSDFGFRARSRLGFVLHLGQAVGVDHVQRGTSYQTTVSACYLALSGPGG